MNAQVNYSNDSCFSVTTKEFGRWSTYTVSVFSSLSIVGATLVILYMSLKSSSARPTRKINDDPERTHLLKNSVKAEYTTQTDFDSTVGGVVQQAPAINGHAGQENGDQLTRRQGLCSFNVVKRPAAFILVCISVADILVAASHLWGVLSNYESALIEKNGTHYDFAECGAQAFVAVFATISTLLWSDILMFVAIVLFRCRNKKTKERLISVPAFFVYNFIGWVLPFLVVVILGGVLDAFGADQGVQYGKLIIYCHVCY